MKKTLAVLAVLMMVSSSVWASAKKVQISPMAQCMNEKSAEKCVPLYGKPYTPNHEFKLVAGQSYVFDANGDLQPNYQVDENGVLIREEVCATPRKMCQDRWYWLGKSPCKCYDPTKPTYDAKGYNACQSEVANECRTQ